MVTVTFSIGGTSVAGQKGKKGDKKEREKGGVDMSKAITIQVETRIKNI